VRPICCHLYGERTWCTDYRLTYCHIVSDTISVKLADMCVTLTFGAYLHRMLGLYIVIIIFCVSVRVKDEVDLFIGLTVGVRVCV
jgi:hypothetical protein